MRHSSVHTRLAAQARRAAATGLIHAVSGRVSSPTVSGIRAWNPSPSMLSPNSLGLSVSWLARQASMPSTSMPVSTVRMASTRAGSRDVGCRSHATARITRIAVRLYSRIEKASRATSRATTSHGAEVRGPRIDHQAMTRASTWSDAAGTSVMKETERVARSGPTASDSAAKTAYMRGRKLRHST